MDLKGLKRAIAQEALDKQALQELRVEEEP